MFTRNLREEILVKPVRQLGATELLIVSGYASASMAYRHLAIPEIRGNGIKVQLIIGMAQSEGISLADHNMFKEIEGTEPFECHYRIERPSVHSKVYVWMSDGAPVKAFVGSANYTEQGFISNRQENALTDEGSPRSAYDYFLDTLKGTMEISHDDIDQHVRFYTHGREYQGGDGDDCVTVSLLASRGQWKNEVPPRSGLNWGQRPEHKRNSNQAYIQIGAKLGRTGFFPARPQRFTVITDDGLSFEAVRAQKSPRIDSGGDAIETPQGNHILGAYFRARLGVQGGALVTRQHLENYGRTDVTFCKLEDETYQMDFSV